jgi:hypothetical protein
MATKKKAAKPTAPETQTFELNVYDRIMLRDRIIDLTGRTLAERLRAGYIRRAIDFSPEEMERFEIVRLPTGGYRWKSEGDATQTFSLEEKDREQIRSSIRMIVAQATLEPDHRFDLLLLKFFTLPELEEMAMEDEKRADKRKRP